MKETSNLNNENFQTLEIGISTKCSQHNKLKGKKIMKRYKIQIMYSFQICRFSEKEEPLLDQLHLLSSVCDRILFNKVLIFFVTFFERYPDAIL